MYSELIVLIISGQEDLGEALRFLKIDRGGGMLRATDIVLIRRDKFGNLSYQVPEEEAGYSIGSHGRLASTFGGILFDSSRAEERRQLASVGLDSHFLQEVNAALKSDGLAYLMYVPNESLIDSRQFLEILGAQKGELYHTTFRPYVEEVLLNQDN